MPSDYPSTGADSFEKRSAKGQPNGYASLDAFGHVPASQVIDIDGPGGGGGGMMPSTTVVAGTSFGLSPTPGVAVTFSPGDHGHGTPPAPFIPSFVQSVTAPAVATGGTIATAGLSSTRVAPTAAVTGVILAVGSAPGVVYVVNESAFGITFAAAGTSHVATGTACVIAALNMIPFVWDSITALWYAHGATGGIIAGGSVYDTAVYDTAVYA